jgi:uncharacterized membrane protein YeaQ/YmgE (transglycosylase-associated protein family)
MQGVGWIGAIIVGGIAGWIAERAMESQMGVVANIILGIAGAVFLNFILVATIGYTYGGWVGQLVVGAIGAIILIWLWRAIRGRRPA